MQHLKICMQCKELDTLPSPKTESISIPTPPPPHTIKPNLLISTCI